MNSDQLVDKAPSIQLDISFNGKKGEINLSSLYGSYKYKASITIPPNKETKFFCPHCKTHITSDEVCSECNAMMIPLNINKGGVVRFCSRSGCNSHNIAFEDIDRAMNYFYDSHCYGCTDEPLTLEKTEITKTPEEKAEIHQKAIIESGTFLQNYCPHCGKSLIETNKAKFIIEKESGESGILLLSPYLNVFTNETTIDFTEGETAKDIKCPHCKESLLVPCEECGHCEVCGADVVGIHVIALNKVIDFYFCSKKGCHWHGLDEEDKEYIILEDSEEW
jgi:hypothetical protein